MQPDRRSFGWLTFALRPEKSKNHYIHDWRKPGYSDEILCHACPSLLTRVFPLEHSLVMKLIQIFTIKLQGAVAVHLDNKGFGHLRAMIRFFTKPNQGVAVRYRQSK
jgi:hypothetical protein